MVANDVALGGGQPPILIVSGPNAGGKTVLMKTVGLAALMARAGLLVAADARSRVGFFSDVRADIGDRQSVMGDLSTFSGHLAARRRHPDGAAPAAGAALVLLDELMAGTNPDQGAALARATAEALASAPGLAIITTHYDSLKALGESDARFAKRRRWQYDLARAAPDVPAGDRRARALVRVRHRRAHGPAGALLERARALAGASSVGLESVIARLEAREAELVEEAERLAAAEAAAIGGGGGAARRRRRRWPRANASSASTRATPSMPPSRRRARRWRRSCARRSRPGRARAAEAGARRARADRGRGAGDSLPAPAEAGRRPRRRRWWPGARVFVERLGADGVRRSSLPTRAGAPGSASAR